ncbi:hypothetical protein QAD02_009322 [Eretmocerus hayati]|uniref:Uncharacterized protein n=1 Tax=Eretmocerus hayati TaxID=131215 RepID=A0ACC2N8X6_9HYME|nr:hypothetical protein QAD02_009322 [Eretmocerus hayati]
MSHATCCIKSCKNTVKNKCLFYRFPTAASKKDQRERWISIVRKVNKFEPDWEPKLHLRICSAHFIGDRKSIDKLSPNYVPTIFTNLSSRQKSKNLSALKRHERFMERRRQDFCTKPNVVVNPCATIFPHEDHNYGIKKEHPKTPVKTTNVKPATESGKPPNKKINTQKWKIHGIPNVPEVPEVVIPFTPECNSQGCQVYIPVARSPPWDSFVCCRYIGLDGKADAEIQTEMLEPHCTVKFRKDRLYKSTKCGTPHKTYVDALVGPNFAYTDTVRVFNYDVISAIKNEEQMLELAGVTTDTFNFLMRRLEDIGNEKVTRKNRLLIFLIKLKSGMNSTAVSVFFGCHRSTVRRVFTAVAQSLSKSIHSEIIYPSRDVVIGTLPQRALPEGESTGTEEECTGTEHNCSNIQTNLPSTDENFVYTYSQCKEEFTAKIYVSVNKSGFVSLTSDWSTDKVNGLPPDPESDSESTIAKNATSFPKGFLELQLRIGKDGKKTIVVLPRFSNHDDAHSAEESWETSKSPRVKVHVKRIVQRLRTFKMLEKIPDVLIKNLDDIMRVCCVLINLQPITITERGPYTKHKNKEIQ